MAAIKGQVPMIQKLLAYIHTYIHTYIWEQSPLQMAAIKGHFDMTQKLLAYIHTYILMYIHTYGSRVLYTWPQSRATST